MHIGLIGGIGPAATDYYYRSLISEYANLEQDLQLTIAHADSSTLLEHLAVNDVAAQVAIYQHLAERLVAAGADCVVVTSIAGHFCIDSFIDTSPLPVINMLREVDSAVSAAGVSRLGILGTATVMQSRFYGGINDADVVVLPDEQTYMTPMRAWRLRAPLTKNNVQYLQPPATGISGRRTSMRS